MNEEVDCELCGAPLPKGEEMFRYHGHSGPCHRPPMVPRTTLRDNTLKCGVCNHSEQEFINLQHALAAKEAVLLRWKIALCDLTAGGSEYANDPDACVAYVREARSSQFDVIKKFKRERDTLHAEVGRCKTVIQKVIVWLERLATQAEEQAKDTRFITLVEANKADAKNYRAVVKDMKQALQPSRGEQG